MGGLTPARLSPHWGTVAVLALAAAPRIWAAIADHGMVWPDEIFQSLEPAHRVVFGVGIEAWEFEVGARSWLLPGVIAALWKLLALVGVDRALTLVASAKLLMAALALAGVYGTMRLADVLAGRAAALLAGVIAATFPLSLVFAGRAIGDGASGTLLVFALLALLQQQPRPLLSGALCGAAVFLKYQNGIVLLGLLGYLAWRDRAALRPWLLGALAAGWLGGLLDWATWGAPFHAFRTYLDYNILQDRSARYGTDAMNAYAAWAWQLTGPALAVLAPALAFAGRRAVLPLALALAFVAAHVAVPHKELRFLLPVVPLLIAVSGAGLARALARLRARAVVAGGVGVLLAASLAAHAMAATLAQVGAHARYPAGAASVWHAGEGVNRLLAHAGAQPDLCGMWVSGIRTPFIGGYSYLHRDVPFLWGAWAQNAWFANYLILPTAPVPMPLTPGPEHTVAADRIPPGYAAIAQSRGWALYAREGRCVRLPAQLDQRRIFD